MSGGPGPAAPDAIGRYRVESVLGRGAMGVIYKAHDPVIDRRVAIKLVRADLLDGEDRAEYITRFQREAQAAGRCTHVNIVGIYDYALHEGNPYLAMEYIDGVALNQVAASTRPLAVAEIVDLVGQMLDGLGAAHALGVTHRDIKPANIMLAARGRVKITDFGISRLDASAITGVGSVVGTPSYMSPEQCRGETADARSDLFSSGVVLYELIAGAKPFQGRTQHEVWHRLLHDDPADTAALRPDAPAHLHGVIRRSLAKDPASRFQSAHEMAAALRGAAGSTGNVLSAAAELDRTVMAARANPAPFELDSMAMSTIERRLAQYVGPIAHFLLKSAVQKSSSVEELCQTLGRNIDSPAQRESFNQELQVQINGSITRAGTRRAGATLPGSTLPDADLARVQAELARYAGPVARVLVKRAAPGCTGVPQLRQRLAQHIGDATAREAFLKLP